MELQRKIREYHGDIERDGHHRYRSWEHCYAFFRQDSPSAIMARQNTAALQLGFYLASWGMYRGSSFLLQHAYTVHLGVINALTRPEMSPLWSTEFGSESDNALLIPLLMSAADDVRGAYRRWRRHV